MRPRINKKKLRQLLNGAKTVTAAAYVGKMASCAFCQSEVGEQLPPEKMWGVDASGITTARLDLVDHWVCESCFLKGGDS